MQWLRLGLAMICALSSLAPCHSLAQTADGSAGGAAAQAPAENPLASEQAQVAERFKRLESLLLKSAEIEAASNPARSALLQQAAQLGKQAQLSDLLAKAAKNLEQKQFSQAVESQKISRDSLKQLLELLQSENRQDRVREERDQVRRWIEEADRLRRLQSSLRGRTEGGGQTDKAASDQQKLSEKAGQIAKELGGDQAENKDGQSSDKPNENAAEGSKDKDSNESKDAQSKGDGKSEDKNSDNKESDKDSKSKDSNSKDANSKDSNSKDSNSKDANSKDSNGKDSNGKSSDGKESGKKDSGKEKDPNKPSDPKADEDKEGGKKPADSKPNDKQSNSESNDGQPSGQSKEDSQQPSESGKSQSPQPSQSQDGQQSGGQSQQQDSEQSPQQQPKSPTERAAQRIKQAQKRMQEAQKQLEDAKRGDAVEKQREAEQELQAAIEQLEEILRQLREEEIERSLAALEDRLRLMLSAQNKVFEETKRLQEIGGENNDRSVEIRARKLAEDERKVLNEGQRALLLLREEGTSAAFPEAMSQILIDVQSVSDRLDKADTGKLTVSIEQEIITSLEELIEALVAVQKEQKEKKQKQQQSPGQQQNQQGDQPLVDQLAEMRLIKTLQLRVNKRTDTLATMLQNPDDLVGQAEAEDIATQIRELSGRQANITQVTRDIVNGKNK